MAPAPRAHGAPLLEARLCARPEDFRVDERLGAGLDAAGFDGAGEHLWLRIEKRLLGSMDVVKALEKAFGVGSRDVGVSGMKDRHAVTRQWFSVRTALDAAVLEDASPDGTAVAGVVSAGAVAADTGGSLRVLESHRHGRKLRRGTHVANAFRIVLRDVRWNGVPGDADARAGREAAPESLERRVAAIRAGGFPNRFGAQRFGRGGQNVARAEAMFARGGRGRPPARATRSMLLSAARSALFNDVLDERLRRGDWDELLEGEPAVLDGSHSFFLPEPESFPPAPGAAPEDLAARLARLDISPSGPLWGEGEPLARGTCAAFEAEVIGARPALVAGLSSMRMAQARRALRARASSLEASVLPDGLELHVTLAPGVYATSLLHELGDCRFEPDRETT